MSRTLWNAVSEGQQWVYESPYEEFRERNGQTVVITKVVLEPNDEYDEEVLPMAEVEFPDGFKTSIFPEEIGF
jgi:hypothetical protein